VSRAVADCANELFVVAGCFPEGEGGAGDAGFGDAPLDGVRLAGGGPGGFFCRWLLEPPHCDIKDRTVKGRTGRNISECFSQKVTLLVC
jgi:hypothetical protein